MWKSGTRRLALATATLAKAILLYVALVHAGFPHTTYMALDSVEAHIYSGTNIDEILLKKDPADPIGFSLLGEYPLTFFALFVIAYIVAHYVSLYYLEGKVIEYGITGVSIFKTGLRTSRWIFLLSMLMLIVALYKIVDSGGMSWVTLLSLSLASLSLSFLSVSISYLSGFHAFSKFYPDNRFYVIMRTLVYVQLAVTITVSAFMVYSFLESYLNMIFYLDSGDVLQANMELVELGREFARLFTAFMVVDTTASLTLSFIDLRAGGIHGRPAGLRV